MHGDYGVCEDRGFGKGGKSPVSMCFFFSFGFIMGIGK